MSDLLLHLVCQYKVTQATDWRRGSLRMFSLKSHKAMDDWRSCKGTQVIEDPRAGSVVKADNDNMFVIDLPRVSLLPSVQRTVVGREATSTNRVR